MSNPCLHGILAESVEAHWHFQQRFAQLHGGYGRPAGRGPVLFSIVVP